MFDLWKNSDQWTPRSGAMYEFLSLSRDKFKNTLLTPLCEVHLGFENMPPLHSLHAFSYFSMARPCRFWKLRQLQTNACTGRDLFNCINFYWPSQNIQETDKNLIPNLSPSDGTEDVFRKTEQPNGLISECFSPRSFPQQKCQINILNFSKQKRI